MTADGSAKIRRVGGMALAVIGTLILGQIAAEATLGRVWTCACGTVKLWEGEVFSDGNSQQVFDWYSFTHLAHGFVFYALAFLAFRKQSTGFRLAAATLLESLWEVVENSPLIIERYRAETISLNYYGDSILNSTSDTLLMIVGFLLAARLPVAASVLIVLTMEVVLALLIRDNLALNVLMLTFPLDAVRDWQAAIAPSGL